jgi:hypothetical protein
MAAQTLNLAILEFLSVGTSKPKKKVDDTKRVFDAKRLPFQYASWDFAILTCLLQM